MQRSELFNIPQTLCLLNYTLSSFEENTSSFSQVRNWMIGGGEDLYFPPNCAPKLSVNNFIPIFFQPVLRGEFHSAANNRSSRNQEKFYKNLSFRLHKRLPPYCWVPPVPEVELVGKSQLKYGSDTEVKPKLFPAIIHWVLAENSDLYNAVLRLPKCKPTRGVLGVESVTRTGRERNWVVNMASTRLAVRGAWLTLDLGITPPLTITMLHSLNLIIIQSSLRYNPHLTGRLPGPACFPSHSSRINSSKWWDGKLEN